MCRLLPFPERFRYRPVGHGPTSDVGTFAPGPARLNASSNAMLRPGRRFQQNGLSMFLARPGRRESKREEVFDAEHSEIHAPSDRAPGHGETPGARRESWCRLLQGDVSGLRAPTAPDSAA